MYGVRQTGYLVGVGPIFVAPIGTESKVAILQCSVEERGWVTRIMAPEHAVALSGAGGDAFPYTENQCSLGEYQNLDYVTLGTNDYLLPDFTYDLKGYRNPFTGWKKTSFTAPNIIRNKAEWDYHGGNPGVETTTPTGTTPKGDTDPTAGDKPKADTGDDKKKDNTMLYVGIAVAVVLVLLIIAKTD